MTCRGYKRSGADLTNTTLAFILDLDGTLVETEGLKALSLRPRRRRVAARPGRSGDSRCLKDFVDRSRRDVATGLLRHFGLEVAARSQMAEFGVKTPWQAYVRVRSQIYDAFLSDWALILTHRYPHNIALLHDLRGMGYRTGLSTMWHTEQARRVMSILGLTDAFDAIATRDNVENGKPDPEIDLLVAHELRARPEDCLVIEDSPAGARQRSRPAGTRAPSPPRSPARSSATPTSWTAATSWTTRVRRPRWCANSSSSMASPRATE